jgi:acyl-CoA dehydrogenase
MALEDQLDWPFFEDRHRALDREVRAWLGAQPAHEHGDVDAACRTWVRALGQAGFLRHCVPAAYGGVSQDIDSRSLCLMRERLAEHDGLADFSFAMQGLGSGAISLEGSDAQRARWLPAVARGEAIAAFALSEPDAGSDVAAMKLRAHAVDGGYRLDGTKTWISNGGIADFYCRAYVGGGRHPRHLVFPGTRRRTGPYDRRTVAGDGAAPACPPRFP